MARLQPVSFALLFALLIIPALTPGCMSVSESEEIRRFEMAGPLVPRIDVGAIIEARYTPGPYRLAPGDIIQMEMPSVKRAFAPQMTTEPKPHLCRVNGDGMITLPMVGEIEAENRTLAEIEETAVDAYYPKYVVHRPAIVATVHEFSTVKISIVGAVDKPGVYPLSREERSLVGALMKAGGIVKEGASAVRVYKAGKLGEAEPIVLPVEDMNIAFADVALTGGETIEVLRLDPGHFSVVGLVNQPGTFEYPKGAELNLLSAIGYGHGLHLVSDPKYIQVFRQDASGEIVSATFNVSGDGLRQAAGVRIRRGDIISVSDTFRTEMRRILSGLFRGGVYVGYNLNSND